MIRRNVVEQGLLNHALGDMPSQASTSASSADCVKRRTVKGDKEQNGHCHEFKSYMWVMLTSVFKLTSRMQAGIHMHSACILSMVSSVPLILSKEQRPSKYKAQLFDCGVPGKIQVLQIPETCSEDSNEGGTGPLRRKFVLSPRKLKKTSRVSCHTSVTEFRGYCGAYSHWKLQQTPVIEKSVPVTSEVCNQAWRKRIVTLPDLTT